MAASAVPDKPGAPPDETKSAAWDRANHEKMLRYWDELSCFRELVKRVGDPSLGAEPGSPPWEDWYQLERVHAGHLDVWLRRVLASEDRLVEKSAIVHRLLDAYRLVSSNYPAAFNDGDRSSIERADAQWNTIERRLRDDVERLGLNWIDADPADPDRIAEHAATCKRVLPPAGTVGNP